MTFISNMRQKVISKIKGQKVKFTRRFNNSRLACHSYHSFKIPRVKITELPREADDGTR